MNPKKTPPKQKKNYYRENPKRYYEQHKAFVQKVKEQGGISIRQKYLETNRRAERNCKHRQNAILAIIFVRKSTLDIKFIVYIL